MDIFLSKLHFAVIIIIVFTFYFKIAANIEREIAPILQKNPEVRRNLKFFIDHGSYVPLSANITKYEILHSPKKNLENIDVIFGVKTTLNQKEKRDAVRRTFGNATLYKDHFRAKFVFLVARKNDFSDDWIADEAEEYDDILYGSYQDSYWNLTFKDSMLFTWTEQNAPNIKFLYRGDYDNFLNPLKIIEFFKEHWEIAYEEAAIWGALYPRGSIGSVSETKTLEEVRRDRKTDMNGFQFLLN